MRTLRPFAIAARAVGCALALVFGTPAMADASLRLAATLVSADDAAALLDAGGEQLWRRVGEQLAGCEIEEIGRSIVTLQCGADQLQLALGPEAAEAALPIRKPALHSIELPPGRLQGLLAQPQATVLGVDFAPVAEDGAMRGWRVARLDPLGPVAGLGLREADLVLAVDGAPATEPAAFAAALRAAPAAGTFTLELLRGDQPLTLLVAAPPVP
jgi:type II secretory pathway component PulC